MQFRQLSEELQYYKAKFEVTKQLEQDAIDQGYTLFEPDFFESYDRFVQMNPRVKSQALVKLLDIDGSVLVLRPDITTSVIKRVIPKWQQGSELRLFYLSTIFSRSSQNGIEEKKQFGIEHLGTDPQTADLETIRFVINLLKRFDLSFLLEISNNQFLNALIQELKLSPDAEKTFKDILYYKNRDALERFLSTTPIPNIYGKLIANILTLQGSLAKITTILNDYPLTDAMQAALKDLELLTASLAKDDVERYVKIDLTVLSQYDYYAGLLFKAYVPNAPVPILSGGRYDPLTKTYGQEIPAIGFTLNMSDFIKEILKIHE
jgi:ATP phosphoribosyltransferase regulatory subunit